MRLVPTEQRPGLEGLVRAGDSLCFCRNLRHTYQLLHKIRTESGGIPVTYMRFSPTVVESDMVLAKGSVENSQVGQDSAYDEHAAAPPRAGSLDWLDGCLRRRSHGASDPFHT